MVVRIKQQEEVAEERSQLQASLKQNGDAQELETSELQLTHAKFPENSEAVIRYTKELNHVTLAPAVRIPR